MTRSMYVCGIERTLAIFDWFNGCDRMTDLGVFLGADFVSLQKFAISVGVGLLVGIERERNPSARAGLRTFALTTLLGAVAAMLAELVAEPMLLPIGLALVGIMMIAAQMRAAESTGDPGTTSIVALAVCFLLGAMIWRGYMRFAVPIAIVMTSLLHFKAELRGLSERVTRTDLASILQFGVITFIVLPLLPDRDMGPYAAFNPHQVWLMVVLIASVSLAGYLALRLIGYRHGAPLLGLFGSLVSSTATTLLYSRQARAHEAIRSLAVVVILLANSVVLLRLCVLVAATSKQLLYIAAPVLGTGFAFGMALALRTWWRLRKQKEAPLPEVHNPTELKTALSFGALYALVLLLSAWLADAVGSRGVYALAAVSGMTDVDAISLSSLRLFALGKLDALQAVTAVGIAALANTAFKLGLVYFVGGRELARPVALGLGASAAGLLLALLATHGWLR